LLARLVSGVKMCGMNTVTLSRIGAAITSALTTLAALPYQLGDVATIIPVEWKTRIVVIGLIATVILRAIAAPGVKAVDSNKTQILTK